MSNAVIARPHGRHVPHALLVLAGAALALPGVAAAQGSGGGGLGESTATPTVTVSPSAPVSTSGDGVTLSTASTTMLRGQLTFTGSGAAGQTIEIERESDATHGRWLPTAQTTVDSTGAFSATWTTIHAGRFAVRASIVAVTSGPAAVHAALASATPATPAVTVTVYRGARATFYGPGLFGGHWPAAGG